MRWSWLVLSSACADAPLAALGDDCVRDHDCMSDICIMQACVAPDDDFDGDGLSNADELALGLDPSTDDTDRDGARDDIELGHDQDGDGIDDALEASFADQDFDCLNDDVDPDNTVFDRDGCRDRPEPFGFVFVPRFDVIGCDEPSSSLGMSFVRIHDGAFSDAWTRTLTAVGTLDGDVLDATLACPGQRGSLGATKVGNHFEGTFTFGAQQGLVFAAPQRETFGVAYVGLVQDEDGRPLAGARIQVAGASTLSASSGGFAIETTLDPNDASSAILLVDRVGYTSVSRQVPVVFGLVTVPLTLVPTHE